MTKRQINQVADDCLKILLAFLQLGIDVRSGKPWIREKETP